MIFGVVFATARNIIKLGPDALGIAPVAGLHPNGPIVTEGIEVLFTDVVAVKNG